MARSVLLAALACIGLPSPGHSQSFVTASQLAHACASHAINDQRDCDGYIAGILDAASVPPELRAAICPPANTKLGALREALGKFGEQRPEAVKGSGVALVRAMMKTNYPCPAS